jgi:opacity protein-like surface antigen
MPSIARATRFFGIVALGVLASPAMTVAADLAPDYPVIDTPEPMPLPAAGGWYLRGDIGYKLYADPNGRMSNPAWGENNISANLGQGSMSSESLGGAGDIGIGVGYKFNDYLRADATLDYETPAQFKGSLYCIYTSGSDCENQTTTAAWIDSERAKISAWSGLINGYVDLATYEGFTPYVGAGAGVAYLRSTDVKSSNKAQDGSNPSDLGNWNFAWALMAGVSYAINDKLDLDLGYRYLNLGNARTGIIADENGLITHMSYDNIQAHEVRLGLRYYLN